MLASLFNMDGKSFNYNKEIEVSVVKIKILISISKCNDILNVLNALVQLPEQLDDRT